MTPGGFGTLIRDYATMGWLTYQEHERRSRQSHQWIMAVRVIIIKMHSWCRLRKRRKISQAPSRLSHASDTIKYLQDFKSISKVDVNSLCALTWDEREWGQTYEQAWRLRNFFIKMLKVFYRRSKKNSQNQRKKTRICRVLMEIFKVRKAIQMLVFWIFWLGDKWSSKATKNYFLDITQVACSYEYQITWPNPSTAPTAFENVKASHFLGITSFLFRLEFNRGIWSNNAARTAVERLFILLRFDSPRQKRRRRVNPFPFIVDVNKSHEMYFV